MTGASTGGIGIAKDDYPGTREFTPDLDSRVEALPFDVAAVAVMPNGGNQARQGLAGDLQLTGRDPASAGYG